METLLSFAIAAALTLFFVRRYLARLTAAAHSRPTRPCPRCGQPIPDGSAYCLQCGAPLALWTVHRAEVHTAGAATPAGKPRPAIDAAVCIGCGSCVQACPEQGALELAGGKSRLARPERCTGHAKCAAACPTGALRISTGDALRTVRVPLVNEQFESNVPGIYVIGELAGKGLIKTAINEGRLAIDGLRRRLAAASEIAGGGEVFDVAIIGAGPAGLSASLTAHQHGLNYLTLEQGELASTIRHYPRHKLIMAEPAEMPLYGTLYLSEGTKETLLSVWETIVAKTGVRIRTNTRAEAIRRHGEVFEVATAHGPCYARYLVLAMGKRGTPRRLEVPGEDSHKVAYTLVEPEAYAGSDILVVGGGDSALEASLELAGRGSNRVRLSHRGEQFDKARERNRKELEAAEQDGRVRVFRSSQVVEIRSDSARLKCRGTPLELPIDYVFVLIGGESPEAFLRKSGIEIVEKAIT